MTKKGGQFFQEKIGVTPSVAAQGDTNPSDATAHSYKVASWIVKPAYVA